jgi:hypothetical protein
MFSGKIPVTGAAGQGAASRDHGKSVLHMDLAEPVVK